MTTLVCGGTFGRDLSESKASTVVDLLAKMVNSDEIYNGHRPFNHVIAESDLIIWMPNISNHREKNYPRKKKGAVLICSKVMRDGYTDADALDRVFKMHGNAVIKVYSEKRPFKFQLLDALGNNWTDKTDNLFELTTAILNLTDWTNRSVRKSLTQECANYFIPLDDKFVDIIQATSKKVVNQCSSRFFGNFSTRCTKLFPSERYNREGYLFSPRNVDKSQIEKTDGVYCEDGVYFGERKPSVDAPVQIEIYKALEGINYMIHGHAFIKNAPFTMNYYPCGDLREVDDTVRLLSSGYNTVNLKNHGFLMTAPTLQSLQVMSDLAEFYVL